MSKEITCTYVATAPTAQSMSGTIKLTGCDSDIVDLDAVKSIVQQQISAQTGGVTPFDVIAIVAGIVLFGLFVQWIMLWLRSHVDKDALSSLRADMGKVKTDLSHVVKPRTTPAEAEQLLKDVIAADVAKASREAKA